MPSTKTKFLCSYTTMVYDTILKKVIEQVSRRDIVEEVLLEKAVAKCRDRAIHEVATTAGQVPIVYIWECHVIMPGDAEYDRYADY